LQVNHTPSRVSVQWVWLSQTSFTLSSQQPFGAGQAEPLHKKGGALSDEASVSEGLGIIGPESFGDSVPSAASESVAEMPRVAPPWRSFHPEKTVQAERVEATTTPAATDLRRRITFIVAGLRSRVKATPESGGLLAAYSWASLQQRVPVSAPLYTAL
jgi:hypothetical protein